MKLRAIEISVGVFMLLFFAAMAMLAIKVSNLTSLANDDGYSLTAKFENVGGLRVSARVAAGGVRVGEVTDITYDSDTFEAVVTLKINEDFHSFPTDTSANIFTAGLLGGQYIGLDPGAEDEVLNNGDEITLTQSALVLERLIGQVFFNRSSGGGDSDSDSSSSDSSGGGLGDVDLGLDSDSDSDSDSADSGSDGG